MSRTTQKFAVFLLLNAVLWSIVPLLRLSLPMDTQEAMVWGKYCLLGTTKHPPLSGWLAYNFWQLCGRWDGAMYILSQLCVAAGVLYIYKLAREFLDEKRAIVAALLQFGVIYYNFSSVEFNVNVISLALWPAVAFYFWRGYTQNRWRDWLLFGLFAGLNLLNKYVGGLLLAAIGVFVVVNPAARQLLKNGKAYAAGLLALAVVAPHLWWLYQTDFAAFDYLAHRSSAGKITTWVRHFIYPLKFLSAQVLFAAAAGLTYWLFYRRNPSQPRKLRQDQTQFLLIVGLLPLAVWVAISLLGGHALKSMWGFPCLFMLGIMLGYFWPVKCAEKQLKQIFTAMAVWTSLFAVAYGVQCMLTTSERFQTDSIKVVRQLEDAWRQNMSKQPLEYVGADVWYANLPALYGSREIKPMIWLEPKANPWFDVTDWQQKGALIIAGNKEEYDTYRQKLGAALTAPQTLQLTFTNRLGKSKNKQIYYGFYRGANRAKEIADE